MDKKFEEMTREERKVAVCKDVLSRLDVMQVTSGSYVDSDNEYDCEHDAVVTPSECDMLFEACEVCARGALLLGRVAVFNKLTWGEIGLVGDHTITASDSDTTNGLDGIFTYYELCELETAFELGMNLYVLGGDAYDAARNFGHLYPDPKDRLRAILENVIQNNGNFVP